MAKGIEVGTAYVSLVPSTRAFGPALSREMSGIGRGASASFTSGFGNGIRNVGLAALTAMKRAALVASAAFAVVGGVVLKAGWDRLTTLDNATKALTITLGSAADAGKLMDQVLAIIEGTPFTLPQFADAAQNLIAFNVPAEKVAPILTAIGDAAAGAGGGIEKVSQLTDTFGKIAAKGRIQMDDVWNASKAGVPVLQILGNAYGKNTDEMQKFITKGAVPADKAMDILTTGIENGSTGVNGATKAFGGLSKALGEGLSGSWIDAASAFGRIGATILKAFEPQIIAGLQGFTKWADGIDASLGPVAKRVSSFFTKTLIPTVKDLMPKVSAAMEPFSSMFSNIDWKGAVGGVKDFIDGFIGSGVIKDSAVAIKDLSSSIKSISDQSGGMKGAGDRLGAFVDTLIRMAQWAAGAGEVIANLALYLGHYGNVLGGVATMTRGFLSADWSVVTAGSKQVSDSIALIGSHNFTPTTEGLLKIGDALLGDTIRANGTQQAIFNAKGTLIGWNTTPAADKKPNTTFQPIKTAIYDATGQLVGWDRTPAADKKPVTNFPATGTAIRDATGKLIAWRNTPAAPKTLKTNAASVASYINSAVGGLAKWNSAVAHIGTFGGFGDRPGGDTNPGPGQLGKVSTGLSTAYSEVGKPYVWGADGPSAFDCSGLVSYILNSMGFHYGRMTTSTIASSMLPGRGNVVTVGLNPGKHTGIGIGDKWFEAKGHNYPILGPGAARTNWPTYWHPPGFKTGGVMYEEGPAYLHGSPTRPEGIFTAEQMAHMAPAANSPTYSFAGATFLVNVPDGKVETFEKQLGSVVRKSKGMARVSFGY